MVEREIRETVIRYTTQYPVVTITGPRQSGKTTLCRMLFGDRAYVSLEPLENRQFAREDPNGFLDSLGQTGVIDEVQRAPDLLSYIQPRVDAEKMPGKYILTGSQNLLLLESISQSLAGRMALGYLLPFTLKEAYGENSPGDIEDAVFNGFYPRTFDMNLKPTEASSFYVSTYIERDLRNILNVRSLSRFETFLRLCAGRIGQILNASSLANDVGVSHNTIREWISILEASFILWLLPPYYKNYGKRLIKSPKLYFCDTGIACYLLGMETSAQLFNHPLKGSLVENMVLMELLKYRFNSGKDSNLYFFRDRTGHEVDFVLDTPGGVRGIEVKASRTVTGDFFRSLEYLSYISSELTSAHIVYAGRQHRLQHGIEVLPWYEVGSLRSIL